MVHKTVAMPVMKYFANLLKFLLLVYSGKKAFFAVNNPYLLVCIF